ncbi:MAG: hypothetical protein NT010_13095 [Proteobacteria bacterium]|nr:hypothetical protein [Pseudomonadota bacterium]
MGLLDMFKQIYNEEIQGEQTVESVVVLFRRSQKVRPHEDPHEALGDIWLWRMKKAGNDFERQDIVEVVLRETFLFACIKPPLCARALGLYFVRNELPQVFTKFPKFKEEYDILLGPVLRAQEDGTLMDMYRTYNPNMEEKYG